MSLLQPPHVSVGTSIRARELRINTLYLQPSGVAGAEKALGPEERGQLTSFSASLSSVILDPHSSSVANCGAAMHGSSVGTQSEPLVLDPVLSLRLREAHEMPSVGAAVALVRSARPECLLYPHPEMGTVAVRPSTRCDTQRGVC